MAEIKSRGVQTEWTGGEAQSQPLIAGFLKHGLERASLLRFKTGRMTMRNAVGGVLAQLERHWSSHKIAHHCTARQLQGYQQLPHCWAINVVWRGAGWELRRAEREVLANQRFEIVLQSFAGLRGECEEAQQVQGLKVVFVTMRSVLILHNIETHFHCHKILQLTAEPMHVVYLGRSHSKSHVGRYLRVSSFYLTSVGGGRRPNKSNSDSRMLIAWDMDEGAASRFRLNRYQIYKHRIKGCRNAFVVQSNLCFE